MLTTSSVTRKKSWQTRPRRVSVLAEMALRKEMLAARLGELREDANLTQEQAAAKVGVTLRQWQRWEAGESVPYPRNLDVIASRFGTTVADFFDETPRAVLADHVAELQSTLDDVMKRLAALELERELATTAARKQSPGRSTSAKKPRRQQEG